MHSSKALALQLCRVINQTTLFSRVYSFQIVSSMLFQNVHINQEVYEFIMAAKKILFFQFQPCFKVQIMYKSVVTKIIL